jgi:hypothetical protein
VPLYLDNNFKKCYGSITIKGTGIFPRLNFDRREAILPITPLNVQASCIFIMNNDGYENFLLKHNIVQEYGNLDIDVVYLDGQMIGLQNSRLRIELRF